MTLLIRPIELLKSPPKNGKIQYFGAEGGSNFSILLWELGVDFNLYKVNCFDEQGYPRSKSDFETP